MKQSIPAVCHDFRSIVTGVLHNITDSGCDLVSNMDTVGPVFPPKAKILLNLLDEKTGQSVNVRARLTAARRRDGSWTYKIRWPQVPDFLAA